MMDGKTFRTMILEAGDLVARFIDEFPELYCVMRITTKAGDVVVVGLEERPKDDPDPQTNETSTAR